MGEEEKTVEVSENPFSFKSFLKKYDDVDETQTESVSVSNGSSDICDDLTDEIPFPDVHQDLSIEKKKAKGKKVKNRNEGQNGNPFSFKHFVNKDAALKTSGRVLQIVDDEICEVVVNSGIQNQPSTTQAHQLPGHQPDQLHTLELGLNVDHQSFDTSQEKNDEKNVSENKSSDLELNSQEDVGDEITKLQDENKKLKKELKEVQQSKEDESKRVASLLKKMKEIKLKENEETAALEKMVHMVEKNLELTTLRALKAEAMAAKLREENKVLKSDSVSKVMYDDLAIQHHKSLTNIKDQASSAAQHLNTTAIKAEESLKQLYAGVESFKLVSELLKSIDKFSTVHNET